MMSPHDNKPPAGKEETNVSSGVKAVAAAAASSRPPQDPPPKCPRCDSPNTKFCYYNNYSLTQPRHFCKTCRRYWTNGGALRNVPIGGGCRKSKKAKPSPRTPGESSDVGGLKFFQGLSPAMDFQLNFPRNNGLILNQFSALDNNPNNCFSLDNSSSSPMGFGYQEMGSALNCQNLTSSIESLSSINQDLHWKLQKQRLGLMFVGDNNNQKQNTYNTPSFETLHLQNQKPQPILFQNLDLSCAPAAADDHIGKGDACGNNNNNHNHNNNNNNNNISLSTEWFFDNSYGATTSVNPTPATSGTNLNGDTNNNNWNGVEDFY